MNPRLSFPILLLGLFACLLGAALLWASGSYAAHQRRLSEADRLATAGRFAEASRQYEVAEAHYRQTFWGMPQGVWLRQLDQLGFDVRAYIQLRRAEMAFREGERLLSVYGQDQSMTSEKFVTRPGNLLEIATTSFQAAASLYESALGQTQDASRQVHAHANHARAWVQLFLIEAFLAPKTQEPSRLRQHLKQAIQSLQQALNAIYTDRVRVASADERQLVMLLESLTRFQRREDVEAAERRRVDRFFRNMLSVPEVTPFGELFRSDDIKSLTGKTGATMRELLLDQRPDAAAREQTQRPSDASRSGRGSADSGSKGKTH